MSSGWVYGWDRKPWWVRGQESACQRSRRRSITGLGRSPLEKGMATHSPGQRSLEGSMGSHWGVHGVAKALDITEQLNNNKYDKRSVWKAVVAVWQNTRTGHSESCDVVLMLSSFLLSLTFRLKFSHENFLVFVSLKEGQRICLCHLIILGLTFLICKIIVFRDPSYFNILWKYFAASWEC